MNTEGGRLKSSKGWKGEAQKFEDGLRQGDWSPAARGFMTGSPNSDEAKVDSVKTNKQTNF